MSIYSLDYDGTYTTDPILWLGFVQAALKAGHTVYCITMRYEAEGDSMDPRLKALIPVIYTGRKAKAAFTNQLGIRVDVWIDDMPEFVLSGSY